MVSLYQDPADLKAGVPVEVGYVLTKVSKAGVRYFFQGDTDPVEVSDGHTIRVARTSLFFGDAWVYDDIGTAEGDAAYLNLIAVSEARWTVEPASSFRTQWGLAE